eukprot:5228871-Amphidinium_carterae.1
MPELAETASTGLNLVQKTLVLHPSWETTIFLGHKRQYVATRSVAEDGSVTMGKLTNPAGDA